MKKLVIGLALVFVPVSGFALSQEYEKCVNAEGHGTVDMCESKEYDRQSEKMEKIYKKLLKTNPSISKSQNKWSKQLDKDCPELSGTTFAYETWSKCLAEKIEDRIVQLENNDVGNNVSTSVTEITEEDQEIKNCSELASRIVAENPKKKPINIVDIAQIVTWKASCVDDVPAKMKKAAGNVNILCHANANKPSGEQKGIFYWEKINGQKSSIGFEWCKTTL